MRTLLIIAAVIVAGVLPLTVGQRIVRGASPRTIVGFSLGCVIAMAFGLVALLGALVDPSTLPASELPLLVGRCVDAAAKLFDHPVQHWPQIVAALLLIGVAARLMYASIAVLRGAKQEFAAIRRIADGHLGGADDDVLVVPASQPFALATGVIRRRVVVSRGLLSALDPGSRAAVLAHERAHVRGRHAAALLLGRIVAKAFAFVLPIRRAMDLLLLGLEMAADEAAAREVGDPAVVANALIYLVDVSTPHRSPVLAAAGGDVGVRVRRLLRDDPPTPGLRATCAGAVVLMGAVLIALALSLPVRARALTGAGRAVAVHAVCHLPHDPS